MANKTPISYLQEWCTKHSLTPVFELMAGEGRAYCPVFVFKCTVGNHTAIGKGSSKKRAKHLAAQSVLNEILGDKNPVTYPTDERLEEDSNPSAKTQAHPSPEPMSSLDNPAGQLSQIAQDKLLRPPEYTFLDETEPNQSQFTCHVTLGKLTETGTGYSKKSAKRQAAMEMLKRVESITGKTSERYSLQNEHDLEINRIVTDSFLSTTNSGLNSTPAQPTSCSSYLDDMRPSVAHPFQARLNDLFLPETAYDPIYESLKLDNKLKFVSIANTINGTDRLHRCLVRSAKNHGVILAGCGIDQFSAKQDAAKNFLFFLRLNNVKR